MIGYSQCMGECGGVSVEWLESITIKEKGIVASQIIINYVYQKLVQVNNYGSLTLLDLYSTQLFIKKYVQANNKETEVPSRSCYCWATDIT